MHENGIFLSPSEPHVLAVFVKMQNLQITVALQVLHIFLETVM